MTELSRKRRIISRELKEIERLIKKHYPDAVFRLIEGPEIMQRGLWLDVYTDMADLEEMSSLVRDRTMDLLIRKKFVLGVLPHTLDYLPAALRNGKARRTPSYLPARASRSRARALAESRATYKVGKPVKRK